MTEDLPCDAVFWHVDTGCRSESNAVHLRPNEPRSDELLCSTNARVGQTMKRVKHYPPPRKRN